MRSIPISLAFVVLTTFAAPAARAQIRETFSHDGRSREVFLYVPESVKPDIEAPLLVLLHGSNRDGASLVNPWRDLAREEGVVLAAPNARDRAAWDLKADGPDFLDAVVSFVRGKQSIDRRRVYLFGHSAGAIHGLILGLLESEYFAAVAVHAGSIAKADFHLFDYADRKIPTAIWVGTADPLFPVATVKATVDAFTAKGIPIEFNPINNHDHNYYKRSGDVNSAAWKFLQQHRLTGEQKFKPYR